MIDSARCVDQLLGHALKVRASDIHIQPYAHSVRVRLRIDGVLHGHMSLRLSDADHVRARIKVLAALDVAEKRRPQDGMFTHCGVPLRVSSFPSAHGEKLVLRVLDSARGCMSLTNLGMPQEVSSKMAQLMTLTRGFVVLAGPTGSGKTTTARALLLCTKREAMNVVTLEDPVEYTLEGVTHTAVQPALGVTFAGGLRSLLRQDPDLLFIGEIRDQETARVAVEAAFTGHFVLTTIHAHDTASALSRLIDLCEDKALVLQALTAIVAQRVVRTLCKECKYAASQNVNNTVYDMMKAQGCKACLGTGYHGRTGLFDFVKADAMTDLAAELEERSYCPFKQDAWQKLQAGEIDWAEYERL